jgi:hypothetical protein
VRAVTHYYNAQSPVTSDAAASENVLFELRKVWIVFWRERFDEATLTANSNPANTRCGLP